MVSVQEFFLNFKKNNRFPYNPANDSFREFERLAEHMNWQGRSYFRNKESFLKALKNDDDHSDDQNYDDDEYDEDNAFIEEYDINKFNSLREYFDYFKYNFDFKYSYIGNAFELFQILARHMEWSKKHPNEVNKLLRRNDEEKNKTYMIGLFKKNGVLYDDQKSAMENLEYISNLLNWNEYNIRRREFDELVGFLSGQHFTTLLSLQSIIRTYGLDKIHKRMPKNKPECKHFLKTYLFVNIYDFLAENKRGYKKFNSLKELRDYTKKNNLFYDLESAKSEEVLKILLKDFSFRNEK